MMDKIPTAEQFLANYALDDGSVNKEAGETALVEFAKLHVKAALEIAAQQASIEEGREFDYLLNCYPNERIQ